MYIYSVAELSSQICYQSSHSHISFKISKREQKILIDKSMELVSPVVGGLLKNLASPVLEELGRVWGVEEDIQRLQDSLSTIYCVLEDAEWRAINERVLSKWLKDLKDVAFDVDDVLDEFQAEPLFSGWIEKVTRFFPCCIPLCFRHKMAGEIKRINRRLDEIAKQKASFHLAERVPVMSRSDRETFAFVNEDEIVGRKHDKEKVIEWLITKVDNHRYLSVLPIVGLGGLGKTTLAKIVFNDEEVKKHFEVHMWVCVGDDFDIEKIARAIIESLTGHQCTLSTLESMCHLIQEKITNNKYLLILDDIWSEDPLIWEKLEELMRPGKFGSKIVITTRSYRVAEIMGTTVSAYKLDVLSEDDCWVLFKQRAFRRISVEESPNLEVIGREIVKKCGGLPLAAKSLGSLMFAKLTEAEWLAIRDSKIWRTEQSTHGILPALRLSYDHLSPPLKQCFIYCSVFPKDTMIYKLSLIQLWMAQGFIQPEKGMELEDIGNQYFNSLLHRSFFQEEEKDYSSHIVSCKMHDLVQDLACFVAKDESCIFVMDTVKRFPQGCRYSSIIYSEESPTAFVEVVREAKRLRSLSLLAYEMDDPTISKAIATLTRLRSVHLDCASDENSLATLCKLMHLRFLELSEFTGKKLPNSITDLCNLQTLIFGICEELEELPEGMTEMSNLRHLGLCSAYWTKLKGMPCGFRKLSNLRTLSLFAVGMEQNHATVAELRHLKQIQGELSICRLENVKDAKEAAEAEMSSKSGLNSLVLMWAGGVEEPTPFVDVLENLRPHPNLKKLYIDKYGGNRWPNWLTTSSLSASSSLPNLVFLYLNGLYACETLPSLGSLPSLKDLEIRGMPPLKKIGREFYYGGSSSSSSVAPSTVVTTTFPSLKYMSQSSADNLEEWLVPETMAAFSSLESLKITECPKLIIQGCLPSSLVKLEIHDVKEEVLAEGGCLKHLSRLRKLTIGGVGASKRNGWKGLKHLTALEDLDIWGCRDLIYLPEGVLIQHHFSSSLKTLSLYGLSNLEYLGGGGGGGGEPSSSSSSSSAVALASLHHLRIISCPELNKLPEWLGGLTSLQSLELYNCPKLEMLPDGIQHLSGLEQLTIQRCRILEPRCEKETREGGGGGEDLHKIAHIPLVRIIIPDDEED